MIFISKTWTSRVAAPLSPRRKERWLGSVRKVPSLAHCTGFWRLKDMAYITFTMGLQTALNLTARIHVHVPNNGEAQRG